MISKDDILAFATRHIPDYTFDGSVIPVQGGLINEVWRLQAVPAPIIIKHAPPYIASAPDIPLKPARIIFEGRCLKLLDEEGALTHVSSPDCRPPGLIARDEDQYLLAMEDIGPHQPLHDWLLQSDSDPIASGQVLGRFIGALHRESSRNPALALKHANLPVQETRLRIQYEAIASLLAESNVEDSDTLGEKARDLGKRLLLPPGKCLIMGDLWPASVLITPNGMRLIDWEFSHYGSPAQDVAHLAAHIWMLAHRKDVHLICAAFWLNFREAYREQIAPVQQYLWSEQVSIDAGLHFGAEILVRTIGGFQSGYLYDGLSHDDTAIKQAVEIAALHLRNPKQTDLFSGLCETY